MLKNLIVRNEFHTQQIFQINTIASKPVALFMGQCLSQDLETGCLKLADGLDQVEVSI